MISLHFIGFSVLFFVPLVVLWYVFFVHSKRKKYLKRLSVITPIPKLVQDTSEPSNISLITIIKERGNLSIYIILLLIIIILKLLGISWQVMIGIIGISFLLIHQIPKLLKEREKKEIIRYLPSSIDYIMRSLMTGNSLTTAFKQVSEADLKVSSLFAQIYRELAVGKSFNDVLKKSSHKYQITEYSLCLSIFMIQQSTGRHDVKTLEQLSELLRKKIHLEKKITSSTAEARLGAYVLASLPILIGSFIAIANPNYIAVLFHTPMGKKLIAISLTMDLLGLIILKKMSQIKI